MESTPQTPADLSMPRSKAIVVAYWIVTALFCLQMSFTADVVALPLAALPVTRDLT